MKLTVAKKMLFLIFTAVVGMVGLVIMASTQMEKVFNTVNYANVNSIPSLIDLDQIRKHTLRFRIQLNRHILTDAKDTKALEETEAKIAEHKKGALDAFDHYIQNNVADEKDKQMVTKVVICLWSICRMHRQSLPFLAPINLSRRVRPLLN